MKVTSSVLLVFFLVGFLPASIVAQDNPDDEFADLIEEQDEFPESVEETPSPSVENTIEDLDEEEEESEENQKPENQVDLDEMISTEEEQEYTGEDPGGDAPVVLPEDAPPMEAPFPGGDDQEFEKTATKKPRQRLAPKREPHRQWVGPDLPEDAPPVGSVMVPHPAAKKGLMKITRKGIYHYRINPTPQHYATSVRFGTMQPPNLRNPDNNVSFEELYTASSIPLVFVDFEWQFAKTAVGKLGARFGTGLLVSSGNGRFKNRPDEEAREKYTFTLFPHNVAAIYRAQFWDKQPLVPYVEGGLDYFVFAEFRDDNEPAIGKWAGSLAGHFAIGGSLLLNWLDPGSVMHLDRQYGINSIWLTAEFRIIEGINKTFDFSSQVISFGFMAEY